MSQILTLTDISYCYPGAPEPLFEHLSATFAAGWAAVLGDNGIGKTTLAKLACGMLSPDSGTVSPNPCKMAVAYCPQRTDETPTNLDDFAADWTGETIAIRDALNIGDDWAYRYETLSGGEAKRLQIACALAGDPDVLVLDEPTNHVDGRTRQAITQAMRRFDGIGIVISHDVELIDATCSRCVMLERRHARGRNITAANTYQGGYTQAAQQMRDNQRADTAAIQSTRKELQRMQRIKRERAQRARELDMRKNQGMRIDIKDIDARKALKKSETGYRRHCRTDKRAIRRAYRRRHRQTCSPQRSGQTLRRHHLDERHAELTQGIDAHPQRPRHRGPTRYAEHRPARPHRHQRSKWQR